MWILQHQAKKLAGKNVSESEMTYIFCQVERKIKFTQSLTHEICSEPVRYKNAQ